MDSTNFHSLFFLQRPGHPPPLHSFPTRRSSDLPARPPQIFGAASSTRPCFSTNGPQEATPTAASAVCGTLARRSEEHTSELQSRGHLVCRLLLEKKKVKTSPQ